MNNRWNEKLIIFGMALVSTHSDSWIKIRVFGPTWDWLQVKLVKKSPRSLVLMWNHENVVLYGFWPRLTFGQTQGWPRASWSFWLKKAFGVLRCPNRLHHVVPDVPAVSWGENDIFGFFKVRYANRGQTKYGINNDKDKFLNLFIFYRKKGNFFFFRIINS